MLCIADCRMPTACIKGLRDAGIDFCPLPPEPRLAAAVASHTDLLLFRIRDRLLINRGYARLIPDILSGICSHGAPVPVLSDAEVSDVYPGDIGLCACAAGDYLICNIAHTDPLLLSLCRDAGMTVLDVRQGYAKCSCAVTADGSIITSDKGIVSAAESAGIHVLAVSPGNVTLPGYDCGFIGGASGLCGDTLYFTGNILRHPDGERIISFCRSHGTHAVSLSDDVLFDVGSMLFI